MGDDSRLRSREAAERWRAGYDRMLDRFGDSAPAVAKQPETHAGLPLQPCYHHARGMSNQALCEEVVHQVAASRWYYQ